MRVAGVLSSGDAGRPLSPWRGRLWPAVPSIGSGTVLASVFCAALWALCHPYCGMVGDSNVYLGRVLADIDPAGVGRDLMFVHDGQSQFSLFRLLARPIVRALGVAGAGVAIGALATACWFVALVALARRLASGRIAWAMVVAVSVLPIDYGEPGIFALGETGALPRPFAEAAVMAALAARLGSRTWLSVAFLAVAVLLHPLMALAGLGVMLVLGVQQRPWFFSRAGVLVSLACAALVVGLAWGGVPLLDRLVQTFDPLWFDMVLQRSPFLFPTLWDASAFAPILAQAATIAIAAHLAPPPQRRVLVAVLVTTGLGLVATVVLSDLLHLLLAVQIQTWRVIWLLAVVGGCALAFCMAALWPRGPAGRVTLALLGLAWFFQPHPVFTLAIAGLALLLHFGSLGARLPLGRRTVVVIYAVVGALVLNWNLGPLVGYIDHLNHLAAGQRLNLVDPVRNNLHTVPICILAAFWLVAPPRGPRPSHRAASYLATILLVFATAWLWDQRAPAATYVTQPERPPGFAALAKERPQEVLWLDAGTEAWYMLGRPQYLSPQQAVGMVFSRPLAMEWHQRAARLVELGLAKKAIFQPWARIDDTDRLHVTQAGIDAFCRQPDAPGTIVIPIERGTPVPTLAGIAVWDLPQPRFIVQRYAVDETQVVVAYGIVPCAPAR